MTRLIVLLVIFLVFCLTDISGGNYREEPDDQIVESRTYIPAAEACSTRVAVRSRKRYFDGCNWCRCRAIGSAACTRKACRVRHRDQSLTRRRPVHGRDHGQRDGKRVQTDRYIPAQEACMTQQDVRTRKRYFNGCNWCRCKAIAESRCNTRICHLVQENIPEDEPESNESRYTPPERACATELDVHKFYFDGCNHCRCLFVGGASCTKLPCPAKEEYEMSLERQPIRLLREDDMSSDSRTKAAESVEFVNSRQQKKRIEIEDRRRSVRRTTPRKMSPDNMCSSTADARRRYYDGCNWCRCFGVGRAMCTLRACPWIEADPL